MSEYEEFVERLEDALRNEAGRDEFLAYLSALTPGRRVELLAEAERRDPAAAAGCGQGEDGTPAARKE